jgi:hypothetical protein
MVDQVIEGHQRPPRALRIPPEQRAGRLQAVALALRCGEADGAGAHVRARAQEEVERWCWLADALERSGTARVLLDGDLPQGLGGTRVAAR